MADPRINLKDPFLAAALAFLVPGAGHMYQGRYFKAFLYAICILGLYCSGLQMSAGQIVSAPVSNQRGEGSRTMALKFAAQFGVGLPGLVGLVQSQRYRAASNVSMHSLAAPLHAPFHGELILRTEDVDDPVAGTLDLKPAQGSYGNDTLEGRFVGSRNNGEAVDVTLGEYIELDRPISNDPGREVRAQVLRTRDGRPQMIGELEGQIPRPFLDRFLVPLDAEQDSNLHRRLGKFHELATVFTMIAGLLNLLATWDAFAGPAYGYGDEPEPSSADKSRAADPTLERPPETPAQEPSPAAH